MTPTREHLVGLEHEFRILDDGVQIDFRPLLPRLGVAGRRLDPGDPVGIRTSLGLTLTCDYAEAEIATPPIDLSDGVADRLLDWAGAGAGLLTEILPELSVEGYSTHFSVSVPDRHTNDVCQLFARTFAPSLMLLVDGQDSPGLLVRPRRGRVELGTDYITGSHLVAGMTMAAGGVLACLEAVAGKLDPGALPDQLVVADVAAVERFGWYIDRRAFGSDLYDQGRHANLRTLDGGRISAQDQLERSWKVAREQLHQRLGPGDLIPADELVSGTKRLPVETERSRLPSPSRNAPPSVEAQTLIDVSRPGFDAKVVAATWHYAVFEISGPRPLFASVPRASLDTFLERLDNGQLDTSIEAELRRRPRRILLRSYHDAVGPAAFWDGIAAWETLAPPEPGFDGVPRLAESSGAGSPTGVGASTASQGPGSSTTAANVASGSSSGDDRQRRKVPPPPPPPRRRWPWILIGLLLILIAIILFVVFTGDDGTDITTGPGTSTPPTVSEPPSTPPPPEPPSTPPPTPPPPTPPPPLVVPDGYGDLATVGQMAHLGRTDLHNVIDTAMPDGMGTSIFSRSDTPAGFYGPSMDIWDSFSIRTTITPEMSAELFEGGGPFACNNETGGVVTLCAQNSLGPPTGEVIVTGTVLLGDVGPDPNRQYTYGAVFESDHDPSNDFRAGPQFDWDLFRDTDTWLIFDIFNGQPMFDVFFGSFANPIASTARVAWTGNTILYFIDADEIPDPSGMRSTAFEHDGSFDPAVSGADVTGDNPTQLFPVVDLPLAFDASQDPIGAFEVAPPTNTQPPSSDTTPSTDTQPSTVTEPPTSDTAPEPSTPTNPPSSSGDAAAVEQFIAQLSNALQAGDLNFLVNRIHPVSIALASPAICDTFVKQRFAEASSLELVGPINGPEPFTVNTSDGPIEINQFTGPVVLILQDQPFDLNAAFAFVDGQVMWLTDCFS